MRIRGIAGVAGAAALLGLIFVWASQQWTNRQKTIASLIVLVVLFLPFILLLGARAGTTITQSVPIP